MEISNRLEYRLEPFTTLFDRNNKISELKSNQVVAKKDSHLEDATIDQLEQKVDAVNKTLKYMDIKVEYIIHQETNRLIVKMYDLAEDRLIREIPSEKMLDIAAMLQQSVGTLVDKQL